MLDQEWLTRQEVAEHARVSVRTVDRAIRNGNLQATKPKGSRAIRIHDSWMAAWLLSFGATAADQINNLL